MGHFSKYITKGSVRIEAKILKKAPFMHVVDVVAFQTPEHNYVLILQHRRSAFDGFAPQNKALHCEIQLYQGHVIRLRLEPDSVSTLVIPDTALTESF